MTGIFIVSVLSYALITLFGIHLGVKETNKVITHNLIESCLQTGECDIKVTKSKDVPIEMILECAVKG